MHLLAVLRLIYRIVTHLLQVLRHMFIGCLQNRILIIMLLLTMLRIGRKIVIILSVIPGLGRVKMDSPPIRFVRQEKMECTFSEMISSPYLLRTGRIISSYHRLLASSYFSLEIVSGTPLPLPVLLQLFCSEFFSKSRLFQFSILYASILFLTHRQSCFQTMNSSKFFLKFQLFDIL